MITKHPIIATNGSSISYAVVLRKLRNKETPQLNIAIYAIGTKISLTEIIVSPRVGFSADIANTFPIHATGRVSEHNIIMHEMCIIIMKRFAK